MGQGDRCGRPGEIAGLLALLREHGPAVEADLSRFHGIDYRDRWAFDADGRRKLTLRMIMVRLDHLPHDAATRQALSPDDRWRWTMSDQLVAHLWGALTGKPHPWLDKLEKTLTRERASARDPEFARLLARGKERLRQRKEDIAAGRIR